MSKHELFGIKATFLKKYHYQKSKFYLNLQALKLIPNS